MLIRKQRFAVGAFLIVLASVSTVGLGQTPDYTWTFDNNDSIAYTITAASSPDVYGGSIPADNPSIDLIIGKRYGVTVVNFGIHPFEVIAMGATSGSDVVLLSISGGGSLQSDPGVAWTDDGSGHVQFTVTQALVDAMNAGGNSPGYRCGAHFDVMRGSFNIVQPPPDFSWTFDANGFTAWRLTSATSSQVYAGALPADNPTINLIVGKRYGVTDLPFTIHPFQVIAKGATAASDVVLLSIGGGGSFQTDPAVAWNDDGAGHVQFNVTLALVNAMKTPGHVPGYRCGIHSTTMRGNFAIFGNGVKIANPIPGHILKGAVRIELQTIAGGLVSPIRLALPNDTTNRYFIVDQVGLIRVISNGQLLSTPFLDVRSRLVPLTMAYDERGLLGLAFHPNFATNRKIYTHTSEPVGPRADFSTSMPTGTPFDHQEVIAEWRVSNSNPNVVDPTTRREVLRIDKPQFNHNGGVIQFGPDGFLYIGFGDGGAADDQGPGHAPNGNAQDLERIYGKILRINVDGNNSANGKYGIPPANPFVGRPGLDEIFAYGVRNPYSFSFDKSTGQFYLGDVGQNNIEEIDLVTRGGNYGWRYKEGSFFFDPNGTGDGFVTTVPVVPLPPGLINPIAQYDHDEGHAVIGGHVYRGKKIPQLAGLYVFGDLATSFTVPSGRLFYLDATRKIVEFRIGATDRPLGLWLKGFGQDRAGEVYVLGSRQLGPTGTTGKVLRIVPLPSLQARDSWRLYE